MREKKIFDRTICFTVFREWVETIQYMAETNPKQALDAFLVLSNFCLYGEEPAAESNPWGVAWPVVSAEARRSISNRRRGFGTEDTVLTDAIKAYHIAHPEATQRAIADALHCSLGKVNKVVRLTKVQPHLVTSCPPICPMTAISNEVMDLQRAYRRERQREGIAIAKEQGKYKGRKPLAIDTAKFTAVCARWRAGEITATAAMKELGMKSNTFYRRVKAMGL